MDISKSKLNKIENMTEDDIKKKMAEINWKNYLLASKDCINPFVPHGTMKQLSDLRNLVRGRK